MIGNKKTVWFACIAVMTVILTCKTYAFAGFNAYMVGADQSTVEKTTFGLDETPWLFVMLPDSDEYNYTWSFWRSPDGSLYTADNGLSTDSQIWISLGTLFDAEDINGVPVTWHDENVKEYGSWTLEAHSSFWGGADYEKTVNFTVSPEPVSAVLFLVGGGVLGIKCIRAKRQ